jgi:uncharacterized protein (TIGR02569 family)
MLLELILEMTGKPSTPTIPLTSHDEQDALPGPEILEAFGVKGEAVPLTGGQRKSFRVADIVLKAVDDPVEAEWSSQAMAHLASMPLIAFHVPTPLEASNGHCVFQGWTAFEFLPGSVGPEEKWKELLDVSHAFHEALRDVQRPTFLPHRSHPWAVADRVAWNEASVEIDLPLRKVYNALVDLRVDVNVTSQAIHGDLTGNILSREKLSPVVIDFSPYWRPVEYADAIIIADGLLDYDRDRSLVELGGTSSTRLQMLVRALIFRLVVANALRDIVSGKEVKLFERALEIVKTEIHRNVDAKVEEDGGTRS